MSSDLLAGVGGVALLGLHCSYNRNNLARIFVFWCSLYLVTVEIGNDSLFGIPCIKSQAVPIDGNLAGSDTKKSAKIDYSCARLARRVDQQVDDPPHRLVGRAVDLLAEDTEQIGMGELLQVGALGRRLGRTMSPLIGRFPLPGGRAGGQYDRYRQNAANLKCCPPTLPATGSVAAALSDWIKPPEHRCVRALFIMLALALGHHAAV